MSNPPSSVQSTSSSEHIMIKFRDVSEMDLGKRELVKTYAEKRKFDHRTLRLLKEGERLDVTSEKTVQDCGLVDGDSVDVHVFQSGGGPMLTNSFFN
ncbi:hypothetical protein HMI56_007136 [Coelomomyces lativittatus]|nr:hypothetical protein HMI56_007136 [Coelomomyces lativittatus]